MSIEPGQRLGPYEIVDAIGAGGMGEVWRAKDTRLDREVAIKVLPPGFAADEKLRARFDREAKAISQFSHPHICTLHDVGHKDDVHYLVMELLVGDSLADRLKQGPLSLPEALRYGREIASALDAAHRQGVTHRDLKPGNVMLTRSGAKLLDFGLAKTVAEGNAPIDGMTNMPTEARPLTEEGTILGTFQYMAPEQLDGLEADARTDIFALGTVLYEMATGHRAFHGGSRSSLIAAIVSSQPAPISSVIAMTPPALDHVVRRCLEKDPDDRWQSAHDVASELQWISEAGSQAGVAAPVTIRRKTRERLAWTIATIAILAVAAMAFLQFQRKPAETHKAVSHILAPEGTRFDFTGTNTGSLAISPNGLRLAFTATGEDGSRSLWIRDLDDPAARKLNGTKGALYPFWSPDSKFVAFFADSKLKKVDISGAPPLTLCDAQDGRSGSWNDKGVILFSPTTTVPIHSVSDTGGNPTPVTTLDGQRGETTHRWAEFLPDGVHFLYMAGTHTLGSQSESNAIFVGSLEPGEERSLLFHARSNVVYSAGHLIYMRDGVLVAHPFDPERRELTGDPFRIEDETRYDDSFFRGVFSVSANETLIYQKGVSDPRSQLVWLDRAGSEIGRIGDPAEYKFTLSLSPDGSRLAYDLGSEANGTTDIWLYDLERNVPTRYTFGEFNEWSPVWSPDGSQIAFSSQEDPSSADRTSVYVGSSGNATSPVLFFSSPDFVGPIDWSPGGETIGITQYQNNGQSDVMLLSAAEGTASDFLAREFNETGPLFSPDGEWALYISDESGVDEIYVAPFPGPGGKWQITNGGATWGVWSGTAILYRTPDGKFWSVNVDLSGDSFRASPPELLFENNQIQMWTATRDGQRILATIRSGNDPDTPLTMVQNWTAGKRGP